MESTVSGLSQRVHRVGEIKLTVSFCEERVHSAYRISHVLRPAHPFHTLELSLIALCPTSIYDCVSPSVVRYTTCSLSHVETSSSKEETATTFGSYRHAAILAERSRLQEDRKVVKHRAT
jgi:hypothetical protein